MFAAALERGPVAAGHFAICCTLAGSGKSWAACTDLTGRVLTTNTDLKVLLLLFMKIPFVNFM